MAFAGTMADELAEYVYKNWNKLDYVIEFQYYQKYMKANLLILKVVKLVKESKNNKMRLTVEDAKGNRMEIHETYVHPKVDVDDIIFALGGICNLNIRDGETLYLPKGYARCTGYDLTNFANMEEISESELLGNYTKYKAKSYDIDRVYIKNNVNIGG